MLTRPRARARSLGQIMRQPVFLTALCGSAVGFGVMIMVMTATPLAMQVCGHPLGAAATVIQWHVLGMFLPSFSRGTSSNESGVLPVMALGVLALAAHVVVSMLGTDLAHFVSGPILVGVGWNFLFIGGTTLVTEAYRPAERAQDPAAHDFLVFGLASRGIFSAGGLLTMGLECRQLDGAAMPGPGVGAIAALAWSRRQKPHSLANAST